MIWLYSGTPGSGKSLDTARDIMMKLRRGQRVIANFPINLAVVQRGSRIKVDPENFIYKDNPEMTVKYLVQFARKNHMSGKESQTLLVIDECSVKFNPREWDTNKTDRMNWIKFLQHHRKLGYNVILVSQTDRLIDRQIRSFIEYDVKHRKANNFGFMGLLFTLLKIPMFVAIEYHYALHEKLSARFYMYSKKFEKLYDSYKMFDDELEFNEEKGPATSRGGAHAKRGGGPLEVAGPDAVEEIQKTDRYADWKMKAL